MKAKKNHVQSWEKQTVYNLENGWKATIEWSQFYGDYVTCLENTKEKTAWHACNGMEGLPDFAKDWIEIVNRNCGETLVRPRFEISN